MEMYTCTHISTLGCRNLWGGIILPTTHIYTYIQIHRCTYVHRQTYTYSWKEKDLKDTHHNINSGRISYFDAKPIETPGIR